MQKFYFVFIFFLFPGFCISQTLATSTLNAGGNSAKANNYQFEWSVGEGASAADFKNSQFLITSGVLQSSYVQKIKNNYSGLNWAADEISIYPIPTANYFTVALKTELKGLVTFRLLNLNGNLLQTRTINYQGANHAEIFDLTGLAPGAYYISVSIGIGPSVYQSRQGTFKTIKI
ncbi:MAG TPA: T9SS type A sorting domain-containing protein [Pelobium sp.]